MRLATVTTIALLGLATVAVAQRIVSPPEISPRPVPSQPPSPGARELSSPQESQPGDRQQPAATDQRGSDQVPLTVKVLPSPKSQTDINEENRRADEHAANERALTNATWALGGITLFLVLVGGAQLALFFVQLRYIRESLDDAKIAADAARNGAIAARDSADISKMTMISRDRAYVHHNGFRWISHPTTGAPDQIFGRIRPRWINSGNTPTRNMSVHVDYELRDTALPDDFVFSYERSSIPAMIAPHGAIESAFRNISSEDLTMIKEGRKFFYAWGTATYRDVFPDTPDRITRFCVFAINVSGDPLRGWHEQNNPLEIIFATYSRHNCADEDCARDDAT
jgi:hypothetical protein